ncbi:MAG: rhodanese-like domain-containing protein [Faecousia sp.]
MKRVFIWILLVLMLLTACGQDKGNDQEAVYVNITAQEAKKIMDSQEGYILLDVRTQEEYDQGHIPGAIVVPDTEIEARAEEVLPDKDQLILVYCRSGRRSKNAAQILVELGYTNIKEFGGIIDWPYEVE